MVEEKSDWTKINIGETGFYRTAYSPELLEKLKYPVLHKKLSPRDRLGIIRDLFALSEAGTIPTTDALSFLSTYKNEDNYTVWVELATGLARLEQLLAKSKAKEALNTLSLELFAPLAHKLGWEKKLARSSGGKDEAHTDALLRSLALGRAGRAGDKKIIKQAREIFAKILKKQKVNGDIRGAVYSIIATHGGDKEYKTLVELYKAETLHEERNRIGASLGDFQDKKILEQACTFAMSEHVRIQDTVGILSSVGSNPLGRDIWWNSIKKNWKTLVSRYGQGGLTLGRAIKAIHNSAEEKHFKAIKTFFKTNEAPGAKRSIDQVLERIEGNIAWLKRDQKIIEKFLK